MNLDEQIIPELPYTWRDALTQGSTGVVADATEEEIVNVKQLAVFLVPVIIAIGSCRVNSWLRTPTHNAAIGGASHSSHLLGAACDLHPETQTVAECKEIIKAMTDRKLFYEINTTNWLHLSWIPGHDFIA